MDNQEEKLAATVTQANPRSVPNLLIVGIIIVMVVIIGVGVWLTLQKATSKSKTTPDPQAKTQVTKTPVFGVYATITKIDKEQKSEASAEATLTIIADNTKEYLVPVSSKTKINKYSAATAEEPAKLLTDKETWKGLTAGERIYLSTSVDLSSRQQILLKDIITIDWYLTPKPNE